MSGDHVRGFGEDALDFPLDVDGLTLAGGYYEPAARHEPGPWRHDRELVDVVLEGHGLPQEWNAWLGRRVGPGDEPLEGGR